MEHKLETFETIVTFSVLESAFRQIIIIYLLYQAAIVLAYHVM